MTVMLPPKTLCLLIVASLSTHLNSLHAGEDACLRIIQTGTPGHASVISTVASSPDGEWVAAGGDDHRLRIWQRKTGRLAHTLSGHRDWVRGIAFHPDGTSLFSVSKNGDVFKWNLLAPARPLRMVRVKFPVRSIDLNSDGSLLAVAGFSSSVYVYDTQSWDRQAYDVSARGVNAVRFSPDGALLAACPRTGPVHLWEMRADASVPRKLGNLGDRHNSVAFSGDGQRFAAAGSDRSVELWNPYTGQSMGLIRHDGVKVFSLAFVAPDLLAIAGSDNTVSVWNVTSKELFKKLEGHTGSVTTLHVAGQMLVSAGYDTTLRFWSDTAFQLPSPKTDDETPTPQLAQQGTGE